MPEQEFESFIKTPLEFFGHSADDIYFGYPAQYHEELAEAKESAKAEIAGIEERRARYLAGEPEALKDRYVSSDEEVKLSLDYAKRRFTQDVNHKWYEKRFRGRYESNVDFDQFPDVKEFVNVLHKWDWDYDPVKYPLPNPLPDADQFARYFNEAIRLNEWRAAHGQAFQWHKALPEDSPDRETAAHYLAFTGNIVLHEYCQLAVKLASDDLAEDDFVSVKHLLTVCWPMALRLEPFIPEEVSRTKQFLRETFLQMAARGSSGFRNHVELFGWAVLGYEARVGLEDRGEQEKNAYQALMAFEDSNTHDVESTKQQLLARVEKLAAGKDWYAAIDVIELSTHAYGWDIADYQEQIDQYAIDGVLYYTSDMSKMDEMWSYNRGKTEYTTCNSYKVDALRRAPGISEEAYQKIFEIEEIRGLEYQVQQFTDASNEEKSVIVARLFEKLASTDANIAQRFANPEIVDEMMKLLVHESIGRLVPQRIDEIVVSVVALCNKGVFSREQQNDALTLIGEHVLARAKDPGDHESFSRLIGYISPILRMTTATEKPEEEVVWKFITPRQFESFMKTIRGHGYERSRSGVHVDDLKWLQDQQFAFLKDIRKAWNDYWAIREEY